VEYFCGERLVDLVFLVDQCAVVVEGDDVVWVWGYLIFVGVRR